MAIHVWNDDQLSMLKRYYGDRWRIWFTRSVYSGTSWSACPVGGDVASVHASTPESLIKALAAADAGTGVADDTSNVVKFARKYS